MKRPLGVVIICYVLGIVLGDVSSVHVTVWLGMGILLALGGLVSSRLRPWALPPLLLVCGAGNLALNQRAISPIDLRAVLPEEPLLVIVRGEVERVDLRASASGTDDGTLRTSARLRLEAVQPQGKSWQPVHGWILASARTSGDPLLRVGQRVELTGLMKPPPGAFARGMFDYRAHLALRGVYRQLEFTERGDVRVIRDVSAPWTSRFQGWAMEVLSRGFPDDDPAVGMLWALCVGWLVPLTDEVSEPFMRSGTMHLFAISGQHVALIAGILVALLRLVRVPRRAVGWVVIPLLWFYTAATGWQPSAIRSTIMMTVIVLGWTLERPVDLLNSLAAAALLILLWDPQQVFHAGFQLSFVVVASIGLLLPPFEQWRLRLMRTDPLLPPELRPRWQQWLDGPLRFVTVSVTVSLAAWLGSLPLIMAYFHLFTPVGLIANVVVVQFGSLALAAALGSLLCSPFAPLLTELFNHAAWFFAHAMANSSEWFSGLPGGWCYVKAPPLVSILAYYAALGLVVSGQLRRAWRRTVPVFVGLVVVIAGAWHFEYRDPRLTVLPLNGGHAVFLEQPDAANWLIDCGDETNWRFRTRPFLRAQGVNHLDNFVLTHGDVRHVGAATNVLLEFPPRQVILNPLPQRSLPYRRFEQVARDGNVPVTRPVAGERLDSWTILHPAASDEFAKADSTVLTMRMEFSGQTLLLAPDLDREGVDSLLARAPALRSDIMILSSPADGGLPAGRIVNQWPPRMLIAVDSQRPASERLNSETKTRLRQAVPNTVFVNESSALEMRRSKRSGIFELVQSPDANER